MKRKIAAGTTNFRERIFIRDTSVTTKVAGLTGLVYNSAGLKWAYMRDGDAAATDVTASMVAGTVGIYAAYSFKEVDAVKMPGVYEIGIPNAAIAAGSTDSVHYLQGATNMEAVKIEYELDAVNYQDAMRFGMTALPNANAGSNGGLPTVGTQIPAFGPFTAGTVNDAAPTTTGFTPSLANGANYVNMVVVFGPGAANAGLANEISGFSGGKWQFWKAWPNAPVNGDTLIVLGFVK